MARNFMYLYGKNSVLERLRFDPASIRRIYLQENFKDERLTSTIRSSNIPVKRVNEKELLKIKKADRLQGIVAEVKKFKYTPFEKMLNESIDKNMSFIFLDGLNDPHNLGAIIRIAACFGNFALVIPEHGACEVNETVLHVASGGENYVPVSQATNLSSALIKAKEAGYWAAGTVVEGGMDINQTSLPFPVCLVLGAEDKGIRYGLNKHLDLKVTLPMRGARLSLNVAMAFAVFAHEITRQRPQ